MASRFRQELSVVPPVRIAVGRRGLTTTIDWSKAHADQGLSARSELFRVVGDPARAGPLATDRYLIPGTRQEFGGGDVTKMTSAGLDGFKNLLNATRQRECEIRADVKQAKWQAALSWSVRALAWGTLVPAVSKSLRAKVDNAVALRRREVSTLKENLAASRISISFDMETAVAEPHRRMLSAFDDLAASNRSWAMITSQQIDRVRARSAAGTVIDRRTLSIGRRADALVDTNDSPLAISVQTGRATAYFYPGFILVVQGTGADFALIDLKELEIAHASTHFTESEAITSDAVMVGKVWAKSNKNGTRDRRFKDNRELPVLSYGKIALKAGGGMNESLMFSRDEASRNFVAAVRDLQRILRTGVPQRLGTPSQQIGHHH